MHTQYEGPHNNSSWQEPQDGVQRIATGLGWFSIGLGLGELFAPRFIARLIGVDDDKETCAVLRKYGVRELSAGIGILSQRKTVHWMWSRVGGDLMDLSSLAAALKNPDSDKTRLAVATAAVAGVTALDVYCARNLSQQDGATDRADREPVRVVRTIIIDRPPQELYRFWRDPANATKFMKSIESVEVTGERRSHWKAKLPIGLAVEWDAEVVEDQPDSFLAWRSLPGSNVELRGSARFEPAPGGRGTLVRVETEFKALGGSMWTKAAKLFGSDPGTQLENDLRRFKQLMEIGEITNSDASIFPGMHAAQPPAASEEAVPVTN